LLAKADRATFTFQKGCGKMKRLFFLGWLTYLFIALFTEDLHAFLYNHEINFLFNPHPNLTDLFADSFHDTPFYYLAKSGHIFMFAVLVLLLYSNCRRLGVTILVGIVLAIGSEVLQLFFNRTGRVLDMFIDGIGIMLGVVLLVVYFSVRGTVRYHGEIAGEGDKEGDQKKEFLG
jgi:VanZ family protein